MTYKELKQYVADKKKQNALEWKKQTDIDGYCSAFTDKDYTKNKDIIVAGKKSYKIKFVHNNIWRG